MAQSAQPAIGKLISENLVTNADFMARDPEQRPLHWILGKQLQTAILTAEQKHGSNRDDHSLKITDTSIQLDIQVRSEKRIANPGTIYNADAWVKSATGISPLLNIEFWDQNGKCIQSKSGSATSSAYWTQVLISLTAPDQATHVSLSVISGQKDTGTSYWDDISLRYERDYSATLQPGIRELFVDDYRIESMNDVQRIVHAGVKSSPLIKATKPWEGSSVYVYGTVYLDKPAASGYRMWYTAYKDEKYYLCYATSRDGLLWIKPNLGIVEYNGSKQNNICRVGTGTVIYDDEEKDPAKRYKLLDFTKADTVQKRLLGYGAFFSADGLHWNAYEGNPVISYGDVSNVTYDKTTHTYIATTKQRMLVSNTSVTPGKMDRAAFVSVSKDFIHWSAPGLPSAPYAIAVEGDPVDDKIAQSKSALEAQIYGMSVHLYESVYIGFPWVFELTSYVSGEFAPYGDGPVQPELAASRDLRHWTRTSRDPIIPLGKAGSWDDGTLYTSSQFLISDKKIELYYGAMNRTHGGSSITQRQTAQIAKASWRIDGFVSLSNGGNDTGVIVTRPFVFTGDQMYINADCTGGSLQVELQDANGSIIPGYSKAESVKVSGDQLSTLIRWKNETDVKALAGKMVRIKFYIKKADLYSYWFNHSLTIK